MSALRGQAGYTLQAYLEFVASSNRFKGTDAELSSLKLGLFGEIGELFSGIKKRRRDQLTETEATSAAEEIGDCLWYLFALMHRQGASIIAVSRAAMKQLAEITGAKPPSASSTANASFRQFVGYMDVHLRRSDQGERRALRSLANCASAIASDEARRIPIEKISGSLAWIAIVAFELELDLEKIVSDNVSKVRARWPGEIRDPTPLFDSACVESEQLPRKMWVKFEERNVKGVDYVYISVNGVSVGDRLTDNSHRPDDYRFHDVFHLAYAAFLGWSPVIRALLKVKRKSISQLDENEDGARAIIIEEGVSTWMFNVGREHLFVDVTEENFSYALLKQISGFVRGYEVDACQPWEWARAIVRGFQVFRSLKENRGGYVVADLDAREITYMNISDVEVCLEYKEVRRKARVRKAARSVQSVL